MLANRTNAGFSVANNQAIRAGVGTYVLALNPDTRVTKGALQQMVDLMEQHPEVGIAGLSSRTGGRVIRPRGQALVPHASQRTRTFHRSRPTVRRELYGLPSYRRTAR